MDLSCFAGDYAEARRKFLRACNARGLAVQSHLHPDVGRQGEALALDVARVGRPDATDLLVISSGCHGIEGFCGSAVQVDLLLDDRWHAHCQRESLAVLYLHALNPYGFSWERRVTQEGVDLNRNFVDFQTPLPVNASYQALAPLLIPHSCPPTYTSSLRLLMAALIHGRSTMQAAISGGQHHDPDGLFFAGTSPTWSNRRVRSVLREHGQRCQRIGWIDIHTGLGQEGIGERIYKGPNNASSIARAKRWWGREVTCSQDGTSVSKVTTGTLDHAVMQECPQAQYNGLTLEFGTLPTLKVLNALRAEQWLKLNPDASAPIQNKIKKNLRAAFYVETTQWKKQVLQQAREVVLQTLAGMTEPIIGLPSRTCGSFLSMG
jgi:hypothetical protein